MEFHSCEERLCWSSKPTRKVVVGTYGPFDMFKIEKWYCESCRAQRESIIKFPSLAELGLDAKEGE